MEGKDETRTEKKTNSHDFMRGNGSDASWMQPEWWGADGCASG